MGKTRWKRRVFLSAPEARERHDENLPLALWELFDAWQRDPTIDGRTVIFDEYADVKLRSRLLELDRQQNPDLYDVDRRYFTHKAFKGLLPPELITHDEVERLPIPQPDEEEDSLSPAEAAAMTLPERLGLAMQRYGIDVASQPLVVQVVAGFDSIPNPRQLGKALGVPQYRTRPASAVYIAAEKLLAQAGPVSGAAAVGDDPLEPAASEPATWTAIVHSRDIV